MVPGAGERVDDDVQCVAVVDAEKVRHILKQQRRRPASTDTGTSKPLPLPLSSHRPPTRQSFFGLPSKHSSRRALVCVRRSGVVV